MTALFITGTDTEIGKTYIATILLRQINARGYKTFGIKPIATGCKKNDYGALVNDDALALMSESSISKDYHVVNPITLPEPIAPHLAAQKFGVNMTAKKLSQTILSSLQDTADINIIEGVGGWSVPLNENEIIADVISSLKLPVILVVGIKLGCLNHAILTVQSIERSNSSFIGWIANCVDPNVLMLHENILTLKKWIKLPCLGVMPYKS